MKKLVIALALVSLAASPTMAKQYHQTVAQSNNLNDEAMRSFAFAPPTGPIYSDGSIATTDPENVIVEGKVVGRDPDPNIRFQLFRDPHPENGSGGE
jgi:hypothetical protein